LQSGLGLELKEWALWGPVLAIGAIIASFFLAFPPNTFSPFCTYTSQYELTAELEVGGEKLTSAVATQQSLSRHWIETINYSGCRQTHGTVLTFKSSDDRFWMIESNICEIGEEVLRDIYSADLLKVCKGKRSFYAIDSASLPSTWRRGEFTPDGTVKLVKLVATATRKWPNDDIDKMAPNILRARYDADGEWWSSPERLLTRRREFIYDVAKSKGPIDAPLLRGSVSQ